ncbi:MAG TPA: sensor histidine kinase [Natronosporangium sp.]
MITQSLRSQHGQRLAIAAVAVALLGSAAGAVPLGWPWQAWLGWSIALDLAIGLAAASLPRWASIAAAVLALATQIGGALAHPSPPDDPVAMAGLVGLAVLVAWLIGRSLRDRREHTEALRASAAAEAVTGERLRIARDLHDLVAHSVGVIAIQAGVGRRVIDTRPEAARDALDTIERTSRETLASLRRTVASLRGNGAGPGATAGATPGLAALPELVATAQSAGIRATASITGDQRPLPADVELAAYRIVQEALTNVVRHSGAGDCTVAVEYGPDALTVDVTDTGRGGPISGTGFGITGMRERAALLGGELTAGPAPGGGFRVHARLPLPAGTR